MHKILLIVIAIMLAFGAQASLSVRIEDGAALLDENGTVIVEFGEWQDIAVLGENLFAASYDGKNYALMNSRGENLTENVYSDLRPAGDLLLAQKNGLWGLLGADGNEISDFIYTRLVTDGECFWALKGSLSDLDSDELFLLDAEGRETETGLMVRRMSDTASEGRIAVQTQGDLAWGYCGGSGDLIIPARYSYAGAFQSGRAAVAQEGKYGAIDAGGNVLLPALYDFLEISPSGMMLAQSPGKGVQVFAPDGSEIAFYDGEETFAALVGEGYAVYTPEALALYDEHGNEILTAPGSASVYEGLDGQYILSDGSWGEECVSIVGTENSYQNIYPLGMAGEQPLYAYMQVGAARYMNDLLGEIQLALDMDNARYGVLDAAGEILLPARYQSIEYLGGGRLLTCLDGLWQMMDSSGNVYWSHGAMQSEEPSF